MGDGDLRFGETDRRPFESDLLLGDSKRFLTGDSARLFGVRDLFDLLSGVGDSLLGEERRFGEGDLRFGERDLCLGGDGERLLAESVRRLGEADLFLGDLDLKIIFVLNYRLKNLGGKFFFFFFNKP